jgi:hypothetical protein
MSKVQIFRSLTLNRLILVRRGYYFCFNRASSLLGLTEETYPILARGHYREETEEERTLELLTADDVEKIYEL